MVATIARLLAVPALCILLVAAEALAAENADHSREDRWHRLHQGFARQYIEECLGQRNKPDWSLEDETDLAMGYWWLMAEDYENQSSQDQLFAAVERGISNCRSEIGEVTCPPEHHALMGNLITMAGQVQVARGKYLSAARYAREGNRMLEAVRLSNPEIGDTYFSLGLYLYYVDLSSPLVRSLQRILFFPPGDSRLGLFYLEKAALVSQRFGPMARVALATIYSNGEDRQSHALSHLRTLRRQYPENPLFLSLTAKALARLGAMDQARALLDEADDKISRGIPPYMEYHRNVFRIIRAEMELKNFSLDAAHKRLSRVMAEAESGPGWVRPVAAYPLARLQLMAGDERAYSALLGSLHRGDENGRHRKRLKKLPRRLEDEGYGPDLHQVFGHWISGDLDSAFQRLHRLREIKGNTGLLSYLLGEMHLQRGETKSARARFRDYLSLGSEVTPGAAGWSLIRLGDIEAESGGLDAARHYYRQAESRDDFSDRHVAVYRLEVLTRMEVRQRQLQED